MKAFIPSVILPLLFQGSGLAAIVLHTPDSGNTSLNQWNALLNSDSPPFLLDMNQDGTVDFQFNRGFAGASLSTSSGNRVIAMTTTDSGGSLAGGITPVQAGSILGGSPIVTAGGWKSTTDIGGTSFILGVKFDGNPNFSDPAVISALTNDFIGMQLADAYIGVEFEAEDGIHYGWIRFTGFPLMTIPILNEDGTFSGDYLRGLNQPGGYIHSWAWETEPGKAIVAGAVPEPGSVLLGGLGGLGLLLYRRRD